MKYLILISIQIFYFNTSSADDSKPKKVPMICEIKKDENVLISVEYSIDDERELISFKTPGKGERKFVNKSGSRELAVTYNNSGYIQIDYKDNQSNYSIKPSFLKALFVGVNGKFDGTELKYSCVGKSYIESVKKFKNLEVNDSPRHAPKTKIQEVWPDDLKKGSVINK